jgi:cobalt-zinc-cadmium efflux system protein
MVAEVIGGYVANSLALVADAGHMLSDVAALGLSLFALWFSQRPATPDRTYGYFRAEILAALVNGVALIVISFGIAFEAYRRFSDPPEVRSGVLLSVAFLGLLANLGAAWVLGRSKSDNLNVRAALLHLAGDIFGSLAAIAAAVLIMLFQWHVVDAILAVMVAALIVYSSWQLVREAVAVLLEGTPSHINVSAMLQQLATVPGVASIHDLHVWTLTSGVHMMSCHAVLAGPQDHGRVLADLSRITQDQFQIRHTTIQVEEQDGVRCETANCH